MITVILDLIQNLIKTTQINAEFSLLMQMKNPKIVLYVFIAGALGGLSNSIVVWFLGQTGITPALGFSMAPELSFEWIFRRVLASGFWGIIFLIPVYTNSPVRKGILLSILPWLSSILYVFPMRMNVGYLGLGFGMGTPFWTLFFAMVWGVTGTLFLSKCIRLP